MAEVSEEVKNFLTTALPLPQPPAELLDKLVEFGMTEMAALAYLQPEKDLKDTLNLYCLRKFAEKHKAYFPDMYVTDTPGTPQATPPVQQQVTPPALHWTPPALHQRGSPSPLATAGPSNSTPYSRAAQSWAERFEIPWEKLPPSVLNHCRNGTVPKRTEGGLLEVVRIICREIEVHDKKPGKANLSAIAKKMVEKYPKTFCDSVSKEGSGKGHSSLANRFKERFSNTNRSGNTYRRRLLEKENDPDAETSTGTKRKPASVLQTDSYGCVRWQPDLQDGQTPESQEESRLWLLQEFDEEERNTTVIIERMAATYSTQRYAINKQTHLTVMRRDWPFLFEACYLLGHFERLMDFSLFERLDYSVNTKAEKLMQFMKQEGQHVSAAAAQLEVLSEMFGSEEPKKYGILLLLPVYFKENKEDIFRTAEDTVTAAELENKEGWPAHPHVVIRGNHPFEDNCYTVVEGCVVAHNVGLRMAFGLAFAAYYCFNIPYPESAANTLEFVQRLLVNINPSRGTKVKKVPGKRRPPISSKVKNLCDKLRDFGNEWSLD